MKKLLTLFFLAWLIQVAGAQTTGYLVRQNCSQITDPMEMAVACLQTTTASGRTAGRLYIFRSGVWTDVDTSGSGAPADATFIVQTANAGLSAEQATGALASGILKNTTTTGVLSIATQGTDYYAPGGTDVAVVDGGTGASSAASARTNLGLAIGTNVQAWDSDLDTIAGLGATDDNLIVGNGTLWQKKALTICTGAGKALTYDTATNTFGCNTIAGGTFDTIGAGTNTTAAMVVGTGASLTTSGSGTITATSAATATALAANPTNCSAGSFPLGIDAAGVVESCTDAATQAELNTHLADAGAHSAGIAGNAATATALAANGTNCGAGEAAAGVDASGNAEGCQAVGGGGGTPNVLDLGDDDVNESTDLVEIAVVGDTNSIFTEPTANKLLIDLTKDWPKADLADAATALAANGANCSAGSAPLGVDASGAVESCFDVFTQAEADTHTADTAAHSATDANTGNRIVRRDASGNFSAGTITATLSGTATSVTGSNVVNATHIDETANYAFSGTVFTSTTVASLGTATAGVFKIVTDADPDCDTGGGSTVRLCQGDGTNWLTVGGITTVPTLDAVFDAGKVIDGANSSANAVKIGNGTVHWLLYVDGTNTPIIEPDTASDVRQRCMTNQTCGFYDVEAATDIEVIDPDAATQIGKFTYGTAYKPLATAYLDAGAFSADGTQCAAPAEATLNTNKPKVWSITCTDNDAGRITTKLTMPPKWDGGTIRIRPSWFINTASTANIVQSWSGQCVRDGDPVADIATTGEQNATISFENENNETQKAFTAAITLQGTCAGGATIYLTGDIDAAGTTATMANARFVGAQLEYATTSRSD